MKRDVERLLCHTPEESHTYTYIRQGKKRIKEKKKKHNYISLPRNSVIILPYYPLVYSCGILAEGRSSVESEKEKYFSAGQYYIFQMNCVLYLKSLGL